MERLDKFLCSLGLATRSQVKTILKAGRVTVDGVPEGDGSRKIDPLSQDIALDGESLCKVDRVVLMLNKPEGYVTATEDARERTVMELIPKEYAHRKLRPVGRLDKATEGLLLFTDDGDLLHRLISPKKEVAKIYYARHEGTAGAEDVGAFRGGLTLADGTRCLPAELEPLAAKQAAWISWKDEQVTQAGAGPHEGCTQAAVEDMAAAELTRDRVYELLDWLDET